MKKIVNEIDIVDAMESDFSLAQKMKLYKEVF